MRFKTYLRLSAATAFLLPGLLWAHHPMGGQTPVTFWDGLLSGFAHPVIGPDHLAFVIAAGLLALLLSKNYLLPGFFIGGTLLGTGLHLAAFDIPALEMLIALTVLIAGALLIWQNDSLKKTFFMGLICFFGIFHGYAYGEAIVGAEPAPLFAYLLGFGIIQYLIALVAMFVALKVSGWTEQPEHIVLRVAGGMIVGIGFVFLNGQLLSLLGLS